MNSATIKMPISDSPRTSTSAHMKPGMAKMHDRSDQEAHGEMRIAGALIAAFDGHMPRLTQKQWMALRRARKKTGRMLSDAEAREVIRRVR